MTGVAFTIAIDGPAAAGKGTISRALSEAFEIAHLDTGLIYRAAGRRTLAGVSALEAAQTLSAEDLSAGDLRTPDVARAASQVAAIPEVRAALIDFQRAFARRAGGAVLDGRDIGTVICPEAEVKFFVTASDEVRAQRRFEELRASGHDITLAQVLADLQERDARDAARATAPMKPAEDAVILDTTAMDIAAAVRAAIEVVEKASGRKARS